MPVLAPLSVTPGTLLPCSLWLGGTLLLGVGVGDEGYALSWCGCVRVVVRWSWGEDALRLKPRAILYEVRLRGLSLPKMGCGYVERACPCVSDSWAVALASLQEG